MKLKRWRVRKCKKEKRNGGSVLRLVRGHWRTVGWFNNYSFARDVVAGLNGE